MDNSKMQVPAQSAASQSNEQAFDMSFTVDKFFVKPFGDGTFDVFSGTGWAHWSRFQRKGRQLRLIAGEAVSAEDYNTLIKAL